MAEFKLKETSGKLVLLATILASGMGFLDGTIVNIAIPTIQDRMSANLSGIQWIVNSYMLMLSSLILLCGALSDKFGRKRIFSYGIVVFTLSSLLCAVAGDITQLTLFRALQGIGAAMMVPGSLSIINLSFDEKERARAIGLWAGLSGGIAALGPFLGGYLVQNFGWPSIFYINLPLGVLALFITLKYVTESRNIETRRLDLVGSVLIFISLLLVSFGLISGPESGWAQTSVVSVILGVAAFVFFVVYEKRTKSSLIPIEIFRSPLVLGANFVTLFLYFALSGVIFFFVLNLQQLQGYSPLMAGISLLPTILIITFLSGPAGSLADRIGPRTPMIVGPLIVAVGMGLLALPGRGANYFLDFLPGLSLFGLGMALVIAPLTKSALNVPHQHSGSASGVNNAVARIAGLLAVALLGAIVLSIFSTKLTQNLNSANLSEIQKNQIVSQRQRLGDINLSDGFNRVGREEAIIAVDNALVYSFRWVFVINAALALLASIVAFFTINPSRPRKS